RVLRPSIIALREPNFLLAQRLAMRFGSILLMRRAVADVTVQYDEGWATLRLAKNGQRVLDPADVIGVAHAQNVPTVTQKSGRDVLRKGNAGVTFNRNVSVVIDQAEIV